MLRRGALTVLFLVMLPATVQAFDHHHHHSSGHSGGDGCNSSSSSSSSSGSSVTAVAQRPPSSASSGEKLVFITSTTYSGALGSLAAADGFCQASASEHGITGNFRAWLSDSTANAYDRIADVGPWTTTAGDVAFQSKAELRGAPHTPLLDESGETPSGLAAGGSWSGSDLNGEAVGADCNGWTAAAEELGGATGSATGSGGGWGGQGNPQHCNQKAPLICFQQ